MRTRTFLLIVALSMVLSGTSTMVAAENTDLPLGKALAHRLAERLQLTDDQKQQIKGIIESDKDTLHPLVQDLKSAQKELRTAIRADNTTEVAVRVASAKVAAVEASLAVERMRLYAKIAPILTDAQKQQLANFD